MNVLFFSPQFPPNFWNFCRGLREAGANPLGLADSPWDSLRTELRAVLGEYYRVQDLHSYGELVRALGFLTFRHGKIDRLDSMAEYWLETEARLRDDFNIPGLRVADMARIKRKSEMKALFRQAGVRVARGRICRDRAELLAFIDEVGFPVVAKPDSGVGAAATYKLEDAAGVEAYLASKPPVEYIVEEFVAGQMVTYDGLADRDGAVVFETHFEYGSGVMEVVNADAEMSYTLLRDIPEDVRKAGQAIVKAFGVRERFFHFEFFRLPDGGLVALEVNVRPPGGYTVDMWNYQGDLDVYREWGNLLVRGRIEATPARPWFVTWVGRKDRFSYAADAEEVRRRFGHLLVHHTRVDGLFARAIGNEGFIIRAPERAPLLEARAFIERKA